MTVDIEICSPSEIVKEVTIKKNAIFTSTSVIDIAKFKNEEVLIKYLLPRKSMAKAEWRKMLKNEIKNLKNVQDVEGNLVKIKGFVEDITFEKRNNSFPCIITDYCKNGNLQMFIERNQDLSWKLRYEMAKQITEGINVLHKNGIFHHDLKITNILIDNSNKPLIADYGLSVVNDPCRSNGIYSAPLFLSPVQLEELFLGSKNPTPYNEKDDIYSLSYIFYSLAYLKKPWSSEIKDVSDASLICSILFENKRPAMKGKVLHPDFERLIGQCWDKNASRRPSIENILKVFSFLLLPDETFKSEVLNKFDSMPSSREMKIKEQELRKEQENSQREKEQKEMQKKAISKQIVENPVIEKPQLQNEERKETQESDKQSIKSNNEDSSVELKKMTPMENFEEEKRIATKKMDEDRQNEKLKKEKEAMDKGMNTNRIQEKKENDLKLEKSRKEQNEFIRDQEDQERFKIREALLKQLELKKQEEAKKRELEKIELQKQMEKEAFEKIEKAKSILEEKEKEKLKREQEEQRKKMEKEAEIKRKWNIQQQKTKELEKKKEEERLKREKEKMEQIKSEEEENFQKTLKAKELEEEKMRKKREEELKKNHEQELIIAKQWKLQQEKLREFEKQKEENLLKEKKRKEEEEKKKKEEALNRILNAKKKLEQQVKKPIVDEENINTLNLLKNNNIDRSKISEFERKKKELLMEKEKQRQKEIAKDESSVFQKALIAKKRFEEKENQRRKEEQEKREMELRREKEKAEKWKDQKKKFEALEEERRRIREGSVNQDPVLLQYSGRVSPSSVSSRVNFFRQKIDSESEHGSPQFRCQSPTYRSISPLPTSPQLRSSSPQFYRPGSPQFRASSPTPSNSSISSNSSNFTYNSNGQYVYKLRSTNMKDFEKRKMEQQREQERQRREAQKQQEQEAFQKLLNAKKKISEIEARKKQEELERKKLNQSGLNNFGITKSSTTASKEE